MLCLILIVGGLLIMMGQHDRSEALFYYFRLEDQVPETHLLRLIDEHISFAFVREKLKESYSETGRPSIDPELLLRILLIGYLYGISSERKLVEELRMHLAMLTFRKGRLDECYRDFSPTTSRIPSFGIADHSPERSFRSQQPPYSDIGEARGGTAAVHCHGRS